MHARAVSLPACDGWSRVRKSRAIAHPSSLQSPGRPTQLVFPPFSNHTARDSTNRNSLTPFPARESKSWPNPAFLPPKHPTFSPSPSQGKRGGRGGGLNLSMIYAASSSTTSEAARPATQPSSSSKVLRERTEEEEEEALFHVEKDGGGGVCFFVQVLQSRQ